MCIYLYTYKIHVSERVTLCVCVRQNQGMMDLLDLDLYFYICLIFIS